jgi:hypothetical protein
VVTGKRKEKGKREKQELRRKPQLMTDFFSGCAIPKDIDSSSEEELPEDPEAPYYDESDSEEEAKV